MSRRSRGWGATLHVLAVENDVKQRTDLAELIRSAGHRVFAVGTAVCALGIAAARAVDLAVVDLCLPDAAPAELIAGLRALQPELPVVTVTGANSRELELRLRRLGLVCYLVKPIRSAEFRGLLAHLDRRLCRGPAEE